MPITHVNRKWKTYYLHIGKTKSGKDKYYFSTKSDETLAETIPDGYEVYENPNAQVFLRIIQPKLITDTERAVVETGGGNAPTFHLSQQGEGQDPVSKHQVGNPAWCACINFLA